VVVGVEVPGTGNHLQRRHLLLPLIHGGVAVAGGERLALQVGLRIALHLAAFLVAGGGRRLLRRRDRNGSGLDATRTVLHALRDDRAVFGRDVTPGEVAAVFGLAAAIGPRHRRVSHRIVGRGAVIDDAERAEHDQRAADAAPPDHARAAPDRDAVT